MSHAIDDYVFVHRLGGLQRDLARYAAQRWGHLLGPEIDRYLDGPRIWGPGGDDDRPQQTGDVLVFLCCRHRLPLGRVPVEVFAADAPGLTQEERSTLAGWTRAYRSAFEIVEVRGDRILVIDPEHGGQRIWVLPWAEDSMEFVQPGGRLVITLVPVRDFFTHLGSFTLIPPGRWPKIAPLLGLQRRAPNPRRWTPVAGQPVPAPQAPCPCGSGQRYKKCCLRR